MALITPRGGQRGARRPDPIERSAAIKGNHTLAGRARYSSPLCPPQHRSWPPSSLSVELNTAADATAERTAIKDRRVHRKSAQSAPAANMTKLPPRPDDTGA